MLSRHQRYPLRQDTTFFQTSQKHVIDFLVVYLQQREGFSQGAVIVSKKLVPKATARNKWKRKLRVLLSPILKESRNVAVVVMPRFLPKDGVIDPQVPTKIRHLIEKIK